MNPDKYTIAEHMLDVGHGHTLYVQDWGNKKAKTPIIFLHGGPGSTQSKDGHKVPFDPKKQRVVFFDQRGAGKSTPAGKWHHNTTQDLAADITKVANYLRIDTFIITGESWGSTLALYYALCEPRRIKAIVTGGIFTGSQAEIDWLDRGLFTSHFPEAWERYLAATPAEHRDNPTAYHFTQAQSDDEEAVKYSTYVYEQLEGSLIRLDDNFVSAPFDTYDPAGMKIEMRYLAKGLFLPKDFIMKNAHKLKMPIYIVQGRYDFVCPPKTAYELSKRAPNVSLTWTISGHKNEHENKSAQRLIFKHLTEGK